MRQSREEKDRTHRRIVEIASARVREQGIEGPGVAEIMHAAGLTHGGFYKHFASRDELIAEAASRAFADSNRTIEELIDEAEEPLGAFVDWYVSTEHRDDPATGCPVAALAGEIRRGDERVRSAYRHQVELYVDHLERLFGGDAEARRQATIALSTLVGSIMLARAVGDNALSEEVLRNVREALKRKPGDAHRARREPERGSTATGSR
jgi:TetR/AcrR family transcriptional regulator, transcriptional repressor for nem operon